MARAKLLLALVIALFALAMPSGALAQDEGVDGESELVVFHGNGCPHCASALEFLDGLEGRWPELVVVRYEVWDDASNREVFESYAAARGEEPQGVPTLYFDDRQWVGFSPSIASNIEAVVASVLTDAPAVEAGPSVVDVPGLGSVDVGDRSMVVATLVIGFVDGANPCSLWALSILLALVLHSDSRRRVLLVGSTFLLATTALYGIYMVGAYSALDYAAEMTWIRVVVAAIAGGFGVGHLVGYVTKGRRGVSISDGHKPSLYRRMRSLADPDRSLGAVLGGTVVLATGVSLLETPCTAGLPLLWTGMLTERAVSTAGAAVLFAVYLTVFLIDELVLFVAAVVTLRATKLQEQHGQALHLVSGALMVSLAAAMLLVPDLLESIAGTLAVIGLAGVLALVVQLLTRAYPPGRLTGG